MLIMVQSYFVSHTNAHIIAIISLIILAFTKIDIRLCTFILFNNLNHPFLLYVYKRTYTKVFNCSKFQNSILYSQQQIVLFSFIESNIYTMTDIKNRPIVFELKVNFFSVMILY